MKAEEFGVDPDREMAEAYRLILHGEWRRYTDIVS
jgi:hypothetical protein